MMSMAKDPYDFLKWEPHQELTENVDDIQVQYHWMAKSGILQNLHRFSNQYVPYIYHVMTLIIFIALLVAGLSRLFIR